MNNIKLKDFLDVFMKEAEQVIYEQPSDYSILYHYTNETAFESIISSNKIYFSEYKYLNKKDPENEEIDYALRIMRSIIIMETGNKKEFKKVMLYLLTLFDQLINYQKLYTVSFCLKKNYDYAWKRYGNNYKGFAIGFDRDLFSDGSDLPNVDHNPPAPAIA